MERGSKVPRVHSMATSSPLGSVARKFFVLFFFSITLIFLLILPVGHSATRALGMVKTKNLICFFFLCLIRQRAGETLLEIDGTIQIEEESNVDSAQFRIFASSYPA
jgi:hypothetical protein